MAGEKIHSSKEKTLVKNNKEVHLTKEENKKSAEHLDLAIFPFDKKKKEILMRKPSILKSFLYFYIKKFFSKPFDKKGSLYGFTSSKEILSQKIFNGKTITENILQQLEDFEKKNNLKNSDLKNIEIISGKLYIRFENGERIAFDLSTKSLEKFIVQTKTKKDLEKLKEEQTTIEKIAMWGTVITLTYGQYVEIGDKLDNAIDNRSLKKGKMKTQKFLKEIDVPINGKKIKITFEKYADELIKNHKLTQVELFKLLKKKGVIYNPETGQFEETAERKLNESVKKLEYKDIVKRINDYSYEEFKEDMKNAGISEEEIISEKEFEKAKIKNIKVLNELNYKFNAQRNPKLRFGTYLKESIFGKAFTNVGGKALHYIMFPIFFKEVHKHSGNLDSYIKSGAEYLAFTLGAKWAGKLPGPFIAKFFYSIIGGGLATLGGKKALEISDKYLLGLMPNREDFFERLGMGRKRNIDVHVYSGGVFNDAADAMNKDIGLDFNKVIKFFYKDFEEKDSLDINIFENNINLGTPVIDYLSERTRGVDHWNKEVEEFKLKAIREVNNKILKKDFKYSDVFENSNYFGEHSFVEDLSKGLLGIYNPREMKGSVGIHSEKRAIENSKKIFEFSKQNIPEDMLLGTLVDSDDPKKGKIKAFDKIKEKLKIFLKENKILKSKKDIDNFVGYYESIFYSKIDEKINEILGNPNPINNLLGISGDIHNSTLEIKNGLRKYIKKHYYLNRTKPFQKTKDPKTGETTMSPLEMELSTEIDKIKIDKDYIKRYSEEVENDEKLLKKALEGDIKIKPEGNFYLIEDKDGKFYHTTGNIEDIIYISKMSKKDREFTKEIFERILHPEQGNLLRGEGSVYLREKRKFKKLLENDKYYIFFNRMIDFKRRKFFIENIKKYDDAVEWDVENSIILNTRKWVIDKVNNILD